MTRATAEALIRRLDINATLRAAGRELTTADLAETALLIDRAHSEDRTGVDTANAGGL